MGLAVAPAIAQTQTFVQSTTVVGTKIKDVRGQEVGVIKDFVLDRTTGCLVYVVISTGTKTVASPLSLLSPSSDPKVYIAQFEREKLNGAPVWESTRMEEYSRSDYLAKLYAYYGNTITLSPPTEASPTKAEPKK